MQNTDWVDNYIKSTRGVKIQVARVSHCRYMKSDFPRDRTLSIAMFGNHWASPWIFIRRLRYPGIRRKWNGTGGLAMGLEVLK